MRGLTIVIAAAIIAGLILLVFVILPPVIYLDPPAADVGTDFNVTAFLFKPSEKVSVKIVNAADNQLVGNNDYNVNPFGVLTFIIATPDFSAGEYKCVISSSRGEFIRNFIVREIISTTPPDQPPDVTASSGNLKIEPMSGKPGTSFIITAKSLRPHTMVTVKVVCCLNNACTDSKVQYIRKGEQEFTNAEGTLVTIIPTDNQWEGGHYYQVTVSDYLKTVYKSFYLEALPLCSCQGLYECGYKVCCAPNFTLPSLTGGSVTLCNEYNNALSPLPIIWINFWNTSCPGCAEYMKIIQHMSAFFGL
jgi:hypothetical protein